MPADPRPLRILMVLEAAYPALRGGGAEAQVRTLSRAMRAQGHRVTVLVPLLAHGPGQRTCRFDGAAVCRLRFPRLPLLGGLVLWSRTAAFLLSRRRRYDAWHVHIAHRMAAICALLGQWLDVRVLTKVSGWWELERGALSARPGVVDRLAAIALRRTERWQAISQRIAGALAQRGVPRERIELLPNAVDTDRFAGMQRDAGAPARFVFIGRLEPEKSIELLVDAFSDIAGRHPDARLLLVGGGTLEDALHARISRLGLASRVSLAGHRDDIEAALADANIGVLCSRIEGLSNTLLESMASAMPMVASRISGNEDFIIHGENGWLFEPGDRDGLAACLADAAATPPSRRAAMGDAARATVLRRASLPQVLARLLVLYRGRSTPASAAVASGRSA